MYRLKYVGHEGVAEKKKMPKQENSFVHILILFVFYGMRLFALRMDRVKG
jgi:hypothetical protein